MAKETTAKEILDKFEKRNNDVRPRKSLITMIVDTLMYLVIYILGICTIVGFLFFMLLLVVIGLRWALNLLLV